MLTRRQSVDQLVDTSRGLPLCRFYQLSGKGFGFQHGRQHEDAQHRFSSLVLRSEDEPIPLMPDVHQFETVKCDGAWRRKPISDTAVDVREYEVKKKEGKKIQYHHNILMGLWKMTDAQEYQPNPQNEQGD